MDDDLGRRWLPAEWLDEAIPQMEASPDAFISREGAGWRLRCPPGSPDRHDPQAGEDPACDPYNAPLEPGCIAQFVWMDDFGHHAVTVEESGAWTCATRWPDRATHFWIPGDVDTLAESMDALVRGEAWNEPLEPGVHEVGVTFWSAPVSFLFAVDAEGTGRFMACAGEH